MWGKIKLKKKKKKNKIIISGTSIASFTCESKHHHEIYEQKHYYISTFVNLSPPSLAQLRNPASHL